MELYQTLWKSPGIPHQYWIQISMELVTLSRKESIFVRQDRPFLKPCWVSPVSWLFSRWWTIWSLIKDFRTIAGWWTIVETNANLFKQIVNMFEQIGLLLLSWTPVSNAFCLSVCLSIKLNALIQTTMLYLYMRQTEKNGRIVKSSQVKQPFNSACQAHAVVVSYRIVCRTQ